MLRQVASGGGNLLLNIGPTPEGDVPEPCEQALLETGAWLEKYGPSVYEATDAWKTPIPIPWTWTGQITGDFTLKGSKVYFHCNRWPGTQLAIGALENKVLAARIMGGPAVRFTQAAGRVLLHDLPEKAPDPLVTVIELEVEGTPTHSRGYWLRRPTGYHPARYAWE